VKQVIFHLVRHDRSPGDRLAGFLHLSLGEVADPGIANLALLYEILHRTERF